MNSVKEESMNKPTFANMEKPEGLSILVFCYNSSWIIERNLERLVAQRSSYPVEILVIDNNSKDETSRIAQTYLESHARFPFKIIHEAKQGLSHARIAGLRQASFKYTLFVDDDNLLEGIEWVDTLVDLFSSQPEIGAIGCGSIAELPVPAPVWWQNPYTFCVGEQRANEGLFYPVKADDMLWGACLCFRTQDALNAWSINPMLLTDRAGNVASAGGDVELGFRLAIMGYPFWYTKKLQFVHVMTAKRLSDPYLKAAVKGGRQVHAVMEAYRQLLISGRLSLSSVYLKTLTSYTIHFLLGLISRLPMPKDRRYYTLWISRIDLEESKGMWLHLRKVRKNATQLRQLPALLHRKHS
jgi:glycosyltransferase involved in cell wall biosynthesis